MGRPLIAHHVSCCLVSGVGSTVTIPARTSASIPWIVIRSHFGQRCQRAARKPPVFVSNSLCNHSGMGMVLGYSLAGPSNRQRRVIRPFLLVITQILIYGVDSLSFACFELITYRKGLLTLIYLKTLILVVLRKVANWCENFGLPRGLPRATVSP